MDKIQAYSTFFTDENRANDNRDMKQGAIEAPLDELELSMDDSELLALANRFLSSSKEEPSLEKIRKEQYQQKQQQILELII